MVIVLIQVHTGITQATSRFECVVMYCLIADVEPEDKRPGLATADKVGFVEATIFSSYFCNGPPD